MQPLLTYQLKFMGSSRAHAAKTANTMVIGYNIGGKDNTTLKLTGMSKYSEIMLYTCICTKYDIINIFYFTENLNTCGLWRVTCACHILKLNRSSC